MKISITNIVFISCKPEKSFAGTFIGFCNLAVDKWIELNSLGCHLTPEGELVLTKPAKKLANGSLKFYYNFLDNKIEEEIRKKVEEHIKDLGIWSGAKVKFDK